RSHRLTPPAFDQCHTAESVPSTTASRTPGALETADGRPASRPPSALHPPALDQRQSPPSAPWIKASTVPGFTLAADGGAASTPPRSVQVQLVRPSKLADQRWLSVPWTNMP